VSNFLKGYPLNRKKTKNAQIYIWLNALYYSFPYICLFCSLLFETLPGLVWLLQVFTVQFVEQSRKMVKLCFSRLR